MVNGYFDILPRGAFSPYVGAGIGFVYYDVDRTRYNKETEVTAVAFPLCVADSSTRRARTPPGAWRRR